MRKRRRIEFVTMEPPLRHVPVHDCEETLIMMSLDQMREFMDYDVLETLFRLLGHISRGVNPLIVVPDDFVLTTL
jgi:hypothetical protein